MKSFLLLALCLALSARVRAQAEGSDRVRDAVGGSQAQSSSGMAQGSSWAESSNFQYVPPSTQEGVRSAFWDMVYRLERRHVAYGRSAGRKDLVEKIRENLSALPPDDQFDAMLRFLRMEYHYQGRESPSSSTQDKVFHANRFLAEVQELARVARRETQERGNAAYEEVFANIRALAAAGPEGLRLSRELANLEPANPAVLRGLAQDLFDAEALTDSIETSREAIRLDPKNAGAYTTMASAMYALNDYEGAAEAASAALQRDPGDRIASSIMQMAKNRVPLPETLSAQGGGQDASHATAKRMLFYILSTLLGGFLIALAFLRAVAGVGSGRREHATISAEPVVTTSMDNALVGNNYRITREIAVGGMGRVFEALDVRLDRRVAIKKMREEIGSDRRERARFLSEARTVASLRHPNIVEIHSVVSEANDIYLVFEYVDGHTVSQYLDHYGRLTFGQALWILQGAAAALEYAHAHDVIHRDLKPSNIMIGRDKVVKVMDFGVARQAKDTLQTLSTAESASGTPPFMSPEQDQGKVCKQSDIYSLAVCFYQMVTGELPFKGIGASMALAKMSRSYSPTSTLTSDLPAGVDEVLAWALEPDPEKRCPTPMTFLRKLQDLINIPLPPPA